MNELRNYIGATFDHQIHNLAELMAAACARAVTMPILQTNAIIDEIRQYGINQNFRQINRQDIIAAALARLFQNPLIQDRAAFLDLIEMQAFRIGLGVLCTRQQLIEAAEALNALDPSIFVAPADEQDEGAFIEQKKAAFLGAIYDYADENHLA